jgi:hypothetical protein
MHKIKKVKQLIALEEGRKQYENPILRFYLIFAVIWIIFDKVMHT